MSRYCWWVVLMVVPLSALAQEPTPTVPGKETGLIERRLFFGNPDKAGVQISPDGKRISYIAPVNGVMNVWVADADKPTMPSRSPRTRSGAFANISGLLPTSTSSICKTRGATKTSTSSVSTWPVATSRI